MSKQVNKNLRKPVQIDAELHRMVKIRSARLGKPVKSLVEGYIIEGLKDETLDDY